jgi:Fe2+ or Zn2+ uptake regulation protein
MARKARIFAAVVDLLRRGERHAWTLDDLHAALARGGRRTDFSSVFRATERLVAEGLVTRVVDEEGRARFELAGAHHDHLHCTRCDDLVPVPCVIDGAAFAALEAKSGGAIGEHNVIFSGLCRACRELTDR